MSFFPFSITLSFDIVVDGPQTTKKNCNELASPTDETPCPSPQHSVDSDSSERFLSPSTKQLQQTIRDRMRSRWERGADEESLSCLEAADAAQDRRKRRERLREQKADAESLKVLVRATEKIEGPSAETESYTKTPTGRSSWSSFDDLGLDTPSPSPRLSSSPDSQEEKEAEETDDPFDGVGPQNDFARSLMEQRQLREASSIWQESSEVQSSSRGNVAELLKYYEELEARA